MQYQFLLFSNDTVIFGTFSLILLSYIVPGKQKQCGKKPIKRTENNEIKWVAFFLSIFLALLNCAIFSISWCNIHLFRKDDFTNLLIHVIQMYVRLLKG